jgi:GNAT superfamily N-acetyltransferase
LTETLLSDECQEISDPHGQTASMAVVPLHLSRDRPALETHFAALDSEGLRYRFCGSIKTAGVMQYLHQLGGTAAHSYGIFHSSLALVAVCQLAQSAGDLEVGISVLAPFRRKGFAMALLEHSARYARARGLKALTIHSVADNTPMLSLARRIGMSVEILEGEADGRLRLRAGTISGESLPTASRALPMTAAERGSARGHPAVSCVPGLSSRGGHGQIYS